LANISDVVHLPVTVWRIDDLNLTYDLKKAVKMLSQKNLISIMPVNYEHIAGYCLLNDIYKRPSLILKVTMPRKVYNQGRINAINIVLLVISIGLIFSSVSFWTLEKLVLRRLSNLSEKVNQIRSSRDLSARLPVNQNDEISSLQKNVNAMLESLENYEQELKVSDEALKQLPDAIIITDLEGKIIDWLGNANRVLGYTAPEMINKPFDSLFVPEITGNNIIDTINIYGDYHAEMPCIKNNGTEILADISAKIIYDDKNKPISILLIIRDITERKRLEKVILQISEREQYRIGQDLHDDLSQQLTGISILAHVLEKKLAEKGVNESKDAGKISELLAKSIVHTKTLARILHPVEIQVGGIIAALQDLADNIETIYNISCAFTYSNNININNISIATHLYRISQEAINNAIKHGRASRILISLENKSGKNILKIDDNGVGFPEPKIIKMGMGLHTMEYRTKIIGGTLNIKTAENKGTTIECVFRNS